MRCPEGTPFYPGFSHFDSKNYIAEIQDVPEDSLGEDIAGRQTWYSGQPPNPFPLPIQIGTKDCIVNGEFREDFLKIAFDGFGKDKPYDRFDVDNRSANLTLAATVPCGGVAPDKTGTIAGSWTVSSTVPWKWRVQGVATLAYRDDPSQVTYATIAVASDVREINGDIDPFQPPCATKDYQFDFTFERPAGPVTERCLLSLGQGAGVRDVGVQSLKCTYSWDPDPFFNTQLRDGFPVACWGQIRVIRDFVDITLLNTQNDLANVLSLIYTDMAAARVAAQEIDPTGNVAFWPIDDDPASGMITLTGSDYIIAWVSGTTDGGQFALQVDSMMKSPLFSDGFESPEIYHHAGRTVASRVEGMVSFKGRCVLVGHSMGGALVCNAAGKLIGEGLAFPDGQRDIHILTFGTPRCLVEDERLPPDTPQTPVTQLSLRGRLRLCEQIHYVNYLDAVPVMPPHGMDYVALLLGSPVILVWALNCNRIEALEQRYTLFADGTRVAADLNPPDQVWATMFISIASGLFPPDPVIAPHAMAEYAARLALSS